MSLLPVGSTAPDFTLAATPDQKLSLSEFKGRNVVLIFYPADWSPVCTDELALYNEILPMLKPYHAELLAISVDGAWCHQAFKQDRCLPIGSRMQDETRLLLDSGYRHAEVAARGRFK